MNIVITGCSKGIGAELVKLWSKDHFVYGLSRDSNSLKELKKGLLNPNNFNYLVGDIIELSPEIINKWITVENIDILINNAGYLINEEFSKINYEDYRAVMDVNFWGPFNLTQLLIQKLANAKGQVCNISSMGGVNYSSKFPGLSLYSSSKGALTILSECLAEELKLLKVRVNTLALGAVQTEMLAKAFPGYKASVSPLEMANYIIEFCNSTKNIINGQIIKVTSSNP